MKNLKGRQETRQLRGNAVIIQTDDRHPNTFKKKKYCASFCETANDTNVSGKMVTGSWNLGYLTMKIVLLIVYLCM